MRILKHAFISQFDLMPFSAKSGYPGFEKGLFFSPEKQMKSPWCPHYTSWVTFNLKTWTHKPVMRGHPLSSSINSGIFCEITSLRLNAMQMRGLKAENTALSRPPVSPSAITPQFSPPRGMNPAQRITHSVIFSAWSHRFFPIAEVSAEKKKCMSLSSPCSGTSSSAVQTKK